MRYDAWIDRGGTFTDCLLRDRQTGALRVHKRLSTDRAPVEAIRALLGLDASEPVPPCDVRMGTTLATNALLERAGEATALIITRGFGDALLIGDQARPSLFDLEIERPPTLYGAVLEVDARVSASGEVLARPDDVTLRGQLARLHATGFHSAAVVVLHGYRAPELERSIGELARDAGFSDVSLSHEVAAEIGLLGRGDTTVADAYLTPLLRRYVAYLRAELPGSRLRIMKSSGGLTEAAHFRGRDAVLSGPAGGVVALEHIGRISGQRAVIGFDMGGTSTDVSRVKGEPERVYETRVAGVRLRTPMLKIHTIAAGGGSLCRLRLGRLTVGPESAGANPGPLCYGRPGATDLALTDVHLALGRVLANRFPFALARAPVDAALAKIADEVEQAPMEVAAGFFEVAVEAMAQAIRRVTVARGHDAREHTLVVFGGAGGQAACAVARRLGIARILFHPLGGVLSAFGMGVAEDSWHGEAALDDLSVEAPDVDSRLTAHFDSLSAEGERQLSVAGVRAATVRRRVDVRYRGTETVLSIPVVPERSSGDALREDFEAAHLREFGYVRDAHPVDLATARVEVAGTAPSPVIPAPEERAIPPGLPVTSPLFVDGAFVAAPVFAREALGVGAQVRGPALVLEDTATLVLDPGFTLTARDDGILEAVDDIGATSEATKKKEEEEASVDPIRLEVMANRFSSIAEQMGDVLQRTAVSTNIRDRLDYSCAVFDREGGIVANAPHIPVHLGAMGESVKAVFEAHPHPAPGDVFITNDPAAGGSHLPDITIVTPVHDVAGQLRFFTACRGHHADVGGITPGSMPAFSTSLDEEGVCFRTERIVAKGRFDRAETLSHLRAGPHPARRPQQNLADLEAQIAANQRGVALLLELCAERGADFVEAYMGHVQDNAAACISQALRELPEGERRFADALDDGTPIVVTVTIADGRATFDFAGTGDAVPGNLNAPRAVTVAAVLYVLRCLTMAPIPLNAGCLRPVTLRIPKGSVLDPPPGSAVAGGNVETSQRVVDVLLGALGRVAASQGTMNNVTFGDRHFGYYETLGGGAGAGPGHDGASAVHTHMTNSRITDAEVLEARYPIRVREFSVRWGTGGVGRHRGGNGLVRELELLAPLEVTVLSQRRLRAPFGLEGGAPGVVGRNLLGGVDVGPIAVRNLEPGETLRIETPGGGGFGPEER